MPNSRRLVAFVLAVIAGVFLLLSGIHDPTGTYQLVIDQLPHFITNQQILQGVNTVALILITISLAGGFAVIAEYSIMSWAGIILAFAARTIAK